MLVPAVLRPEQREDGELEVVRLPAEQLENTVELPVGQAEGMVKRLFRNGAQTISLASRAAVTTVPTWASRPANLPS